MIMPNNGNTSPQLRYELIGTNKSSVGHESDYLYCSGDEDAKEFVVNVYNDHSSTLLVRFTVQVKDIEQRQGGMNKSQINKGDTLEIRYKVEHPLYINKVMVDGIGYYRYFDDNLKCFDDSEIYGKVREEKGEAIFTFNEKVFRNVKETRDVTILATSRYGEVLADYTNVVKVVVNPAVVETNPKDNSKNNLKGKAESKGNVVATSDTMQIHQYAIMSMVLGVCIVGYGFKRKYQEFK